MADKKKKDPTAPKRPMILRSDREVVKEPTKEKSEKEKQPTIILKTREQSASKDDRPVSPKAQADSERPHAPKIAQNENKDKKEHKTSQPCKPMIQPVKLLNENLEFNNAAMEFLNDSNTNYLVVGILGTQGVGKSMILNLLNKNIPYETLCSDILQSYNTTSRESELEQNDVASLENQIESLNFKETDEKKNTDSKKYFKFKIQDLDQIERGVHCTKGIDMYVTSDRVILLDCQALWSPSFIEETSTNPVTARSANILTVDCLQIASYLMAICHVVIAVQDWFVDYNFIRYIQTAEMLKPSLSASSSAEGAEAAGVETRPHLLLLQNRCQLEDYLPQTVRVMQEFYRKSFHRSNLQLSTGMFMYSDGNQNGLTDSVSEAYSADACGAPLNLFLLPEVYSDYDNKDIYRGHPSFESLAKRLRWMILGVHRHQLTNVPNLSERSWHQYCNKAWETIRKCTFYMEYERFLP